MVAISPKDQELFRIDAPRALVPAQALGTDTVIASIVLHSAASPTVQIGAGDTVTVDMRPSWEGIGTGIVVIVLVLVFGGGVVRQILRKRKRRWAPPPSGTGDG